MGATRAGPESFGFPRDFKVLLWISGVGSLGLTGFMGVFPWLGDFKPGAEFVAIGGVLLFGTLTLCVLSTLRRLPEKIHIDDRTITHEVPDGEYTTLRWDQVSRVVDRPLLQRLELHGDDGFTVIRIENQLEDFDHLREVVLERTGWEDLEEVPELPATFIRGTPFLVAVGGCAVVLAGIGLAAALLEGQPGGLLLIPLGLSGFSDWLLIRVDRSGITLRSLFWKRTIPIDQIEDVQTETLRPGYGAAMLAVSIRLRNGKTRSISGVQGGELKLYRTLQAAVRSET